MTTYFKKPKVSYTGEGRIENPPFRASVLAINLLPIMGSILRFDNLVPMNWHSCLYLKSNLHLLNNKSS